MIIKKSVMKSNDKSSYARLAKYIMEEQTPEKIRNVAMWTNSIYDNDDIDLFSGYLKCSHCSKHLVVRKSKNQVYYYCSSYIKDKSCIKYIINKKKLKQMVKNKISKTLAINIEELNRKLLNELVNMIYI